MLSRTNGLFAAAALAISFTANAATPQLVRNVNDAVIPNSSHPHEFGELNGKMLFVAGFDNEGLWSTDGTTAGTVLIRQFAPAPGVIVLSGTPAFAKLGARGYFVGNDAATGLELWTTDGTTAGTKLVVDLRPGQAGGLIDFKGTFDNRLIFATQDSNSDSQMYITDGTAAGTQALTTLSGSPNAGLDGPTFIDDDKFYFVAHDSTFQRQVWVSDGTPAGTHALPVPGSPPEFSSPRFFQRIGNRVLFAAGRRLWTIDPATDAMQQVTSGTDPGSAPIAEPISFGTFALYVSDGPAFGSLKLWRTDGTEAGTTPVGDIHPGPAPFAAQQAPVIRKVGNKVVYIADDGVHGPQLWSSDGSPGNTVRLTNATMPANVSHQVAIPVGTFADTGFFMMPDGANVMTWSMWRTDGTIAGTRRVLGLPSVDQSTAAGPRMIGDDTNVFILLFDSPQSSLWKYEPAPDRLTSLRASLRSFGTDLWFYDGQRLYFADNDLIIGNEPWVSDGTAAGTHLIRDISPQGTADNGSAPNELVEFGGRAVFTADDGVTGRELWISDGTAAGTTLLADLIPGFESSNPNHLAVANGALYFFATDAAGVSHFMRLSSPSAQPEALADASPASIFQILPDACEQDVPVGLGGNVYFSAQTLSSQLLLWKSDGTAAGTGPVVSASSSESAVPCDVTVFGNRLYFSAFSPTGNELWTSDGTSAGTAQLVDIVIGEPSSWPTGPTVFNGQLFFTARHDQSNSFLWRTDGTVVGTRLAAHLTPIAFTAAEIRGVVDNKLLIEVFNPGAPIPLLVQRHLWTSGGSAADTSMLAAFVTDGTVDMVVSGGRAYFAGNDSMGFEPWVSDATAAGTHVLKDLNAAGSSNPTWFADFRGVTLLAVDHPTDGPQLWRTNGTEAGTTLIAGIAAPPTGFLNRPPVLRQRATVGQKFFFVATDPEMGDELYVLVNETPVTGNDSASSANSATVTINVLTNDSDADGTLVAQSVRIATSPAHGAVTINASGALIYTPTAGFSGTDTFAYTVDDNQGATSSATTVTVSVTAPPGVVTTGSRGGGGGGSMNGLGLLALCGLLVLQRGARLKRPASPTRSSTSRTSASRATRRARRTTSAYSLRA